MDFDIQDRLYFLWFDFIHLPNRLWFKWQHRHETAQERKDRLIEKNRVLRDKYEEFKRDFSDLPDSKSVMEIRKEMDELMENILNRELK